MAGNPDELDMDDYADQVDEALGGLDDVRARSALADLGVSGEEAEELLNNHEEEVERIVDEYVEVKEQYRQRDINDRQLQQAQNEKLDEVQALLEGPQYTRREAMEEGGGLAAFILGVLTVGSAGAAAEYLGWIDLVDFHGGKNGQDGQGDGNGNGGGDYQPGPTTDDGHGDYQPGDGQQIDSRAEVVPAGCELTEDEFEWLMNEADSYENIQVENDEDLFEYIEEGRIDVYKDGETGEEEVRMIIDVDGDGEFELDVGYEEDAGYNVPDSC